ncbi:translation initiation factor IF-2-like [Zalophus californianus]|uniref:Translation initiation factor IF-2-like n=1 Tax=Zalophus californianus TaxID=9704 RepID=A0A6P9FHF4_ZALCA|nr:translation initiation factor IF-2-like [Zalophus californianus]
MHRVQVYIVLLILVSFLVAALRYAWCLQFPPRSGVVNTGHTEIAQRIKKTPRPRRRPGPSPTPGELAAQPGRSRKRPTPTPALQRLHAQVARAALPGRPLRGGGRPNPLPPLADVVGLERARARIRPDEPRLPARSPRAAGGAHRAYLGWFGSFWGLCGPVWLEGKWSKSPSPSGSPNPSDRGPAAFAAGSFLLLPTWCVRAPQWPGPCEWNGRRGPGRRGSARPVKGTGGSRGSPLPPTPGADNPAW